MPFCLGQAFVFVLRPSFLTLRVDEKVLFFFFEILVRGHNERFHIFF